MKWEAVKSFRIVELKECLKMFGGNPNNMRKGDMQKHLLNIIDSLRHMESNVPLRCYMKILELQKRSKSKPNRRRRRGLPISYRKQSLYGESPFFTTVEVLANLKALRSHCYLFLNISPKNAQLLRKQKTGKRFTHEIQFQFRTEENNVWRPKTIRLKVNEKNLELLDSPPIVYLTQYCLIGKNALNNIEVELPDNEQCLTLVVSIVRRFSPSTLQDIYPVKEGSKTHDLLEDYLNDTGEYIYEITLVSPIGKRVMSCPCRGTFCKHPDVFDLQLFLERMQYYLFWKCPICEYPLTYKTLEIDSFLKSFLEQGKLSFTFYKKKKEEFYANSEEIVLD